MLVRIRSRDMDALIYLNLALSHTGRFSDDLMRFPQIGVEGFIPHDPKSRMGLIEASEVAWQVGQVTQRNVSPLWVY